MHPLVARMTPEEKIGQMLMPAVIPDETGMPSAQTREMVQRYGVGFVITYGHRTVRHLAESNNRLQRWAAATRLAIPVMVGADLESGRRHNVALGGVAFPRQMGIGAAMSEELAYRIAQATARQARAAGVHWDFSPLVDVNTNPHNPVVGIRAFGDDPRWVGRLSAAMIRGYQEAGVVSTPKHYPGHGDTSLDSHQDLPTVDLPEAVLRETHLAPFAAAFAAGADSIMTAHIVVRSLDPDRPATLSPASLTQLLRREQGVEGVVVTDAMSMGAIADRFGAGDAARMAVEAGADVVMATGSYADQVAAWTALVQAVLRGDLPMERIDASVDRILRLKEKYGLLQGDRPLPAEVDPDAAEREAADPAWRTLASEAFRRSLTVVVDRGVLPLRPETVRTLLVTGPREADEVAAAMRRRYPAVVALPTPGGGWSDGFSPSSTELAAAERLARSVDAAVVLTYSSFKPPLAPGQVELVRRVRAAGIPVVVVALGLPYDVTSLGHLDAFVATYAQDRWGTPSPLPRELTDALAALVSGAFEAQGRLPVVLDGRAG
ncbi:MAG: glycoside hydrolase family 3 protein [Firmicutes bacterium]|nr:glycoside hydrolase family 3 protein [Bacillota bacterium]